MISVPKYLAAAVQMQSTEDVAHNLQVAESLIRDAARRGAQLVVLPELFTCLGSYDSVAQTAEPIPGPTISRLAELSRELAIHLVSGSLPRRMPQSTPADRFCNASAILSSTGDVLGIYHKIHLFDVDIPGRVTFQESRWVAPGSDVISVPTPLGQLGLAICYDLRFPELFRKLIQRGTQVIALPAAFTQGTGKDHWEVLIRARAIENQSYVVAANQWGRHSEHLTSYGHSMIVDPWGTVLARAPDGPGLALAEIDLSRLAEIRERIPCIKHSRLM